MVPGTLTTRTKPTPVAGQALPGTARFRRHRPWSGEQAFSQRRITTNGTIPRDAPSIYEVDGKVPSNPGDGTANGGPNGSLIGTSSGLAKQDFAKFVQFFRQASPYVEGHRGKTFVIVIPGAVSP